ncbi:unnamed protein product [Ectocarpus sp. 6 AP-2014]
MAHGGGRGRGMTLPAWMTKEGGEQPVVAQAPPLPPGGLNGNGNGYPMAPAQGQFADPPLLPQQPPQPMYAAVPPQQAPPPVPMQPPPPEQRERDGRDSRRRRSPSPRRDHRDSRRRGGSRSPPRGGGGGGYGRSGGYGGDRDRGGGYGRGGRGGGGGIGGGGGGGRFENPRNEALNDRDRIERRRKRRALRPSNFDVKPDDPTAVALLEASAQQMLVSRGSGVMQSAAPQLMARLPGASNQQTRHARRLYIGGCPKTTEEEMSSFFNEVINRALEYPIDGGAVASVYVSQEKAFAFLELKTMELATSVLELDGIVYKETQLKMRRPSDYNPQLVPAASGPIPKLNLSVLGIISSTVPDSDNKVFIGGLPYNLTEDQVRELLSAFGPLKSFHLVRDPGSPTSKGYGFCEYLNAGVTAIACEGLHGMTLGDKTLTVRPATDRGSSGGQQQQQQQQHYQQQAMPGMQMGGGQQMGLTAPPTQQEQMQLAQAMAALDPNASQAAMASLAQGGAGAVPSAAAESAVAANLIRAIPPTRVLVMLNMVTEAELRDPQEYEDIVDDIQQECSSHGTVLSIIVPRPGEADASRAVGKVFVEYDTKDSAQKAALSLAGRQFGANIVKVEYLNEEKFARREFE